MTSGGTGDVLCGIVGALSAHLHARGEHSYFKAAACGAYISGKAGELASKKFKDALIATDVIDAISNVLPG
jgi:NAD(P)H-hydrate epimerase